MERSEQAGLNCIRAAEYGPFAGELQHIFLAGDLAQPCPHPFFRDERLEILVCEYEAGENGCFHWHSGITEYEFVMEGSLAYQDAATGRVGRFRAGDLVMVFAGVCVRRLMDEPCRTLAIKVPSDHGKIQCRQCPRDCCQRQQEFGAIE